MTQSVRKYFTLLGFFLIPIFVFSQFKVKIIAHQTPDSIAYLRASLFDDKNYVPKDTLQLYGKHTQSINNKSIIGGLYFLYFPKTKQRIYFILENKDTITIRISGNDYINTAKTYNLKNNILFNYQRVEYAYATYDSSYAKAILLGRKFNAFQKAAYFKPKTDTLAAFRNQILKTLKKGDFLFTYFTNLNYLDISVPDKRNFSGRDHFINQFDLNDNKFFFTPYLKQVLLEYLTYYPTRADSLFKAVDTVMNKLQCNAKCYKYVFDYFTKLMKNREVQNNTEGYALFIRKYALPNYCKILDTIQLNQYKKDLKNVEAQKVKDTCKNVILKDSAGTMQDLHSFAKDFDFTAIMFYAPSCEHCQVEVPQMDSTINYLETKFKIKIGRYAICNDIGLPRDKWLDFIRSNHLSNHYMHVELPADAQTRIDYDAYSNPITFLIDNNSILIGKKLGPTSLKALVASLQNKNN